MGRSKDSARKIYMQEENVEALDTLLESVRNMLPKEGEENKAEKKRRKMMENQKEEEAQKKKAAGTKQSFQVCLFYNAAAQLRRDTCWSVSWYLGRLVSHTWCG